MLYFLAEAKPLRLIEEMAAQNVSTAGITRMALKGQTLAFKVTGLKNPAALILKQELLSKGGEAALSEDAIMGATHEQTVLLLATPAQYRAVCQNLAVQPFGLAKLAKELQQALVTLISDTAPARPQIMGIANITPDSFYDGGKYLEPQAAAEHIFALAEEGADIIDIGAASSRPGHTPLSAEEELSRLLPVLELVVPNLNIPISVDTDKAAVAQAALNAGAGIINDVGGMAEDMAALAAQTGVPLVLMHAGGGGAEIVSIVTDFFRQGIERGLAAGMKREQFILDPGFGFGKNTEENTLLLRHLADFKVLGLPLLVGISNKRFIGALSGAELNHRGPGNIAAAAWAMARGGSIIRVHDVRAARQCADVLAAMLEEGGTLG